MSDILLAKCKKCEGSGVVTAQPGQETPLTCEDCNGCGKILECMACKGTGIQNSDDPSGFNFCDDCDGCGWEPLPSALEGYSKLQILEAMQALRQVLILEKLPDEAHAAEAVVLDIIDILEGKPMFAAKMPPPNAIPFECIYHPEYGQVPVLGTIEPDGTIVWSTEDSDDADR